MALSAYVGNLSCPASTGNSSTTGVGFQPKIVLFWSNGLTAAGAGTETCQAWGAGVSSSARFGLYTAGSTSGRQDNGKCVTVGLGGSAPKCAADLVSLDSDGFTLNWTTVSSGVIVNYLALGGADLTNAAIKQFTSPTSTGNQSTTGVGFQPDAVLFFSTGQATAPPATLGSNIPMDQGWMTAAAQGAMAWTNTAGTTVNAYQRTASAFAGLSSSSKVLEATYVSLDSDGFTLNWTSVLASARYVWAVCLKGGQYKLGAFDKPTATGNSGVTGVGFQPAVEAFLSFGIAAQTTVSTAARAAMGAATGTANRSSVANSDEGTFTNQSYLTTTAALRQDGDGTAVGEADFVSHDSDGFTLNWTTADATARQVLYLAVGSSPVAAAPPQLQMDSVAMAMPSVLARY
jgi:hypothetical protein